MEKESKRSDCRQCVPAGIVYKKRHLGILSKVLVEEEVPDISWLASLDINNFSKDCWLYYSIA